MLQPIALKVQQALLILFCFFLLRQNGSAQENDQPDSLQKNGTNGTAFNPSFNQWQLYNGREHMDYLPTIKGDAYFLSDYWLEGSVNYDGILHQHIPLMYDMVKDLVVIKYRDSISLISLVSEKVKAFWVGQHHFIRIQNDSGAAHMPPTGFYEQLYDGPTAILAKRRKVLKERNIGQQIETSFEPKDEYYAAKDGIYYSLKNERSFLDLFTTRKRDVQQYLRKNRIKFKKDREYAMVKAAAYFDTLK